MKILAIDTSCDETSAAITDGVRVISTVVSSQVRYHKKFGGVVPFLAQRLHKERIDAVITLAMQRAKVSWSVINGVAVTYGPGLAPALQVGVGKAKELAENYQKPLYAIDHMAGHIASCWAQMGTKELSAISLPALAVLASGNHTEFVYIEGFGKFKVVGQTLDDALGEAYDKVGRMLGLGYPGGHLVAKLAQQGDASLYSLPIPMQHSRDFNVSYSGLKNAVRLLIESLQPLDQKKISDVAASFEYAAQKALLLKVEKVLGEYTVKSLLFAGGVAANVVLGRALRKIAKKEHLDFFKPNRRELCGDNAAMIGVAAFLGIEQGQRSVVPATLDRNPSLTLDESSFLG